MLRVMMCVCSEAASTAFQNLYTNKNGLLDAWGDFWAKVAETFQGDKHIIGAFGLHLSFV